HGRPQPVLVEAEDVQLAGGPVAAGHHGPALVVDLEHQLVGLLTGVAEQLLEHVGHVGHEVDRVVPHDDDPGGVGALLGPRRRLVGLDGERGAHRARSSGGPAGAAGRTAGSGGAGAGSWRARWRWRTAAPTTTEPRTCRATRPSGTPVKYWR